MKKFQISLPAGRQGKTPKLKELCLIMILVLAAFLRLWKLDQFPAGLNADEAAIGYNAYSLILTGHDEHGDSWPIHFKSFGDYKPGLYFYLVLPFVKFLGLNIWAVRLPSAILGILSVLLIYLLTRELFQDSLFAIHHSLFASLLLAISPWHLHFSRGGWETNAATFFILGGTYFFFKSLRNPRFYLLLTLFYLLSLYTYHSARIIVPLLGLGLLVLYRKRIFRQVKSKWFLVAGIMGLILLVPLMIELFSPAGFSRFTGVGLLADPGPLWRINELRAQHADTMAWPVRLLHNRFLAYGLAFIENWFDHFHGEFLFLSGDVIERNRVPETGQMYLFDILLIALGIYFLFHKRPKNWPVIFLWLAVAPVAAAMTFQTPHALRSLTMVVPLVIISAYGLYQSILWIKKEVNKKLFATCYLLFAILLLWCVSRYLHQYYVHYPQTYPFAWEYGFDQLVDYVQGVEENYEKIYITDRYDQPYILFLFYLRYPPENFQQEVKLTPRDQYGFSTVRDFGKFHFGEINWEELQGSKKALIIGTDEEIPEAAKIIKQIYLQNRKPVFQITER
jgi:4-amino-4-deoxy-L-arabinose transferase-like glycosyltransferase